MKNKTALLLCTLLASSIMPSYLLATETITVNAPWQIDEAPSSGTAIINCTLKTNDCSPLQTQSKTLKLSGTAPFKGTQSFTFEGKDIDDKANVVCVLSTESDSIGDVKQLSGNNGNCNWKENNEPQGFFSNVTQTISSFFGGDDKPEECPVFECKEGEVPYDSNDDGCLDVCKKNIKEKKKTPSTTSSIVPSKRPEISGNTPTKQEITPLTPLPIGSETINLSENKTGISQPKTEPKIKQPKFTNPNTLKDKGLSQPDIPNGLNSPEGKIGMPTVSRKKELPQAPGIQEGSATGVEAGSTDVGAAGLGFGTLKKIFNKGKKIYDTVKDVAEVLKAGAGKISPTGALQMFAEKYAEAVYAGIKGVSLSCQDSKCEKEVKAAIAVYDPEKHGNLVNYCKKMFQGKTNSPYAPYSSCIQNTTGKAKMQGCENDDKCDNCMNNPMDVACSTPTSKPSSTTPTTPKTTTITFGEDDSAPHDVIIRRDRSRDRRVQDAADGVGKNTSTTTGTNSGTQPKDTSTENNSENKPTTTTHDHDSDSNCLGCSDSKIPDDSSNEDSGSGSGTSTTDDDNKDSSSSSSKDKDKDKDKDNKKDKKKDKKSDSSSDDSDEEIKYIYTDAGGNNYHCTEKSDGSGECSGNGGTYHYDSGCGPQDENQDDEKCMKKNNPSICSPDDPNCSDTGGTIAIDPKKIQEAKKTAKTILSNQGCGNGVGKSTGEGCSPDDISVQDVQKALCKDGEIGGKCKNNVDIGNTPLIDYNRVQPDNVVNGDGAR